MKKLLFTCIFLILILFSFLYPAQIIDASKSGILVWFEQILPALLPFTVLSTLLLKSKYLKSFSNGGTLLAISITMCCGFIFGFPIGAKLAADFYKSDILTKKQATILSITSNNFSPMYVCGFVLPTLFSNQEYLSKQFVPATYLLLYFIPLCLCTICLCFDYMCSFHTTKTSTYKQQTQSKRDDEFQLNISHFDISIINGFELLIKLCGYIVLFSIFTNIIQFVCKDPSVPFSLLLENFEITNGIKVLTKMKSSGNINIQTTYIFAIQILSLGGLSGLAQTYSIFADSKLSIYKYIIGKVILSLLLTLLSVIYVSYFIHSL